MPKPWYFEGVCNTCDGSPITSDIERAILSMSAPLSDAGSSAASSDWKPSPFKSLSMCSGCQIISYCSRDCQVRDFQEHKKFCKAVRSYHDDIMSRTFTSAEEYYKHRRLEVLPRVACTLKRHLNPLEIHALMYQRVCLWCLSRDTSKLVACEKCRMEWYCKDNATCKEGFEKTHVESQCLKNQVQFAAQLFRRHGNLPSIPDRENGPYSPVGDMGWEGYFQRRAPFLEKSIDGLVQRVMASILSVPLTILHGLERLLGPESLGKRKHLNIHLLGASVYEMNCLAKFEEILHLLPELTKLTVVMVGPDMPLPEQGDNYANGKDVTCQGCNSKGCSLALRYYNAPYHVMRSSHPKEPKPDLCVAFSSGCHEKGLTDMWLPSLVYIIENKVPTIFTSYTEEEASQDMEVLWDNNAHFVFNAELNPYKCEVPVRDLGSDAPRKDFFYVSTYWFAVCGISESDDETSEEEGKS